jgi:hypothetical protein
MIDWWRQRPLFVRLLAYAVAAILAFVVAAGVGAVAALVVSGNVSLPTGERTRPDGSSPPGEQGGSAQRKQADADKARKQYSGTKLGQATPQDKQTTYLHEVGEIQARSVEAFLDSHKKLLRYDALTSGDVEKMQADQAALKGFADQAGTLQAPPKYREHKVVFVSAIDQVHQAAQLAYALAADPVSATEADFGRYDHLVDEAAAGLQRSNEILGKDYKTIEGVQGVSTSQ